MVVFEAYLSHGLLNHGLKLDLLQGLLKFTLMMLILTFAIKISDLALTGN